MGRQHLCAGRAKDSEPAMYPPGGLMTKIIRRLSSWLCVGRSLAIWSDGAKPRCRCRLVRCPKKLPKRSDQGACPNERWSPEGSWIR